MFGCSPTTLCTRVGLRWSKLLELAELSPWSLRASLRLPEGELEAWIAGLIRSEGCIDRQGWTNVSQANADEDLLRVAASYQANASSCGKQLWFPYVPHRWKREVLVLSGDDERHYWRGIFDGDGSFLYDKRYGSVSTTFNWNRECEDFVGEAYVSYLRANGLSPRIYTLVDSRPSRRARIGRAALPASVTVDLIQLLGYPSATWVLSKKRLRALQALGM